MEENESSDPPVLADEPMQETSESVEQTMETAENNPDTIKSENVDPKPSQSLSSPQRVSNVKRLFTPEEIQQIKSIYCSGLPEELSGKETIREYFSEFGEVLRVFMSLKKMACTVHFRDHKSAASAKKYGGVIGTKRFCIFWSQSSLSKSTKSPPSAKREEKKGDVSERKVKEDISPGVTTRAQTRRKSSEATSTKAQVTEEKPLKPARRGKGKGKTEQAAADVDVLFSKNANIKDLQEMLKKPAKTPEEKYRVLEARDKLMRMGRGKELKQGVGGRLHGTCPDMCPEKERYLRESQHQVHPYELKLTKEYSMNHTAAIKQYSRSSADQEEPLPHELRPSKVLVMAMNYMVLNIMDRSERKEENLRDWYFYVWDRTRAIRKDITQQQLCDVDSALLVEQCARFHIHCAERLVGEDLSVFDEKINNENLTKCLQTLKHLYHDLAMKGEYCPNEAEFRCYIILMNLGDGNFMWEVQELRQEIQQSTPVRFAVQVYFALSSGNYVRFFNLVKSASYLNACLMHRYFNQVRTKALAAIARSYSFQSKVAQFPISNLVDILNFESLEQGEMFCEHYGLELDPTRKFICLGRNALPPTNSVFPPTRAINVIESKRKCTIGEVIVGGKVTEAMYQAHTPHSSFDEFGMLRAEAWDAVDQEDGSFVLKSSVEAPTYSEVDNEALFESISAEIMQELIEETVRQEIKQIFEDLKDYVNKLSSAFLSMYCETFVRDFVRDVCTSTLKEMKNQKMLDEREAEKKRKLLEEEIDKSSKEIYSSLLAEVIDSLCECEASSVLRKEMEEHTAIKEITNDIVSDVTYSVMKEIYVELISLEKEEKAHQLFVLAEDVKKQTRRYYFNLYRKAYEKKRQLKISMQGFPAWISDMSLEEQVKWFGSSNCSEGVVFSKRKWSTAFGCGLNVSTQTYPLVSVEKVLTLPLFKSIMKSGTLINQDDCRLTWEVAISLPEFWEGKIGVASEWIERCFNVENSCKSHNKPLFQSEIKINNLASLDIILRKEIGISDVKESNFGVNGVLFILNGKQDTFCDDIRRLNWIMNLNAKLKPCQLSLLIIGSGSYPSHEVLQQLDLDSLFRNKRITHSCIFYHDKNSKELPHVQLEKSLHWLAQNAEFPPPVEVHPLKELLQQLLVDDFWMSFHLQAKENEMVQLIIQDPNDLISIYNEAVQLLADLCCRKNYLNIQNVPETEIDALDENYASVFKLPKHLIGSKYLNIIKKLVESAKIPKISSLPAKDFQELEIILQDYCSFVSCDATASAKAHTLIMQILNQEFLNHNQEKSLIKVSYYSPWPSVLKVLTGAHLESINFIDPLKPELSASLIINKDVKKIVNSAGNWWMETSIVPKLFEQVQNETKGDVSSCESEDNGEDSFQDVTLKDMKETLDKVTAALAEQSSRFASLKADLESSINFGSFE